jgi:integrase
MGNTGIRIGEMRGARWKNLSKVKISVGHKILFFSVDGKTGKRVVIANTSVESCVKIIWAFGSEEAGHEPDMNEPIFCHIDGSNLGSYKKGFISLLKECNLRVANNEGNRTLYSLKHNLLNDENK